MTNRRKYKRYKRFTNKRLNNKAVMLKMTKRTFLRHYMPRILTMMPIVASCYILTACLKDKHKIDSLTEAYAKLNAKIKKMKL